VIELRLTHPALDFWVDVRLRRIGGAWLAVADLASTPEVATAPRPDLTVLLALWPLGPAMTRRLTARADLAAAAVAAKGARQPRHAGDPDRSWR
jgi:hypothetical protein